MLNTLALVALGGAIGASLRFLCGFAVLRAFGSTALPLPILGVNVLGSLLMGGFAVYAGQRGATHLGPFVMTGVLGGFTTFSAFSLETVTLIERGQVGLAGLYMMVSVGFSVGALLLGVWIMRGALT